MRYSRELELAIFNWIEPLATIVGYQTVMFAQQDAPQPEGDYLVIEIDDVTPDRGELRYEDVPSIPENPQVAEMAIARLDVTITLRSLSADDAQGMLQELVYRFKMSASEDLLIGNNLGLVSIGSIENRTYLEEATNRKRADVTLQVCSTKIYEDILQTIGTITTEGELDDWSMSVTVSDQ